MENESKLPVFRLFTGLKAIFPSARLVLGVFFLISINNNALLAQASSQSSISSATIPQGYFITTLPSTGPSAQQSYYLSLPLNTSPIFRGVISSFTANTVTYSGAGYVSGTLATASEPYFVTFTSGKHVGRSLLITNNVLNGDGSETLTLDTDDGTKVNRPINLDASSGYPLTTTDTFQIYAGQTLTSVFGDTPNNLSLKGGVSSYTADTVSIYNPALFSWIGYYFNTNNNQWQSQSTGNTSQNNLVLQPGICLLIKRGPGRIAQAIMNFGEVPIVPLKFRVFQNSLTCISTGLATDINIGSLAPNNLSPGASYFSADTIAYYDTANLQWNIYYQNSRLNQWASNTSQSDQSDATIPAGSGILIKTGPTLENPSFPYLSFVTTLPYAASLTNN